MATRFGGNVPQKTGSSFLLVFLGFLVVVIVLLAFVVFSGNQGAQSGQEIPTISEPVELSPSSSVSSSKKEILVSIQRIEEGAQFGAHMFQAIPWDIETLPQGAVFPGEMEMIVGKFSTKRIDPSTPILKEYISESAPINLVKIPPGYRAVTITVDSRSGVEGYARPNTRVDVLWTYIEEEGKKQKVTTIVPFAKVLSVSGGGEEGEAAANSLVTLLVTIQQAKKIELARKLGELSLALIGEAATGLEEGQEIEIDITDLIPEKEEKKIEEQHDGTMIVEDPKTGKKTRYVLVNGRWKTAEE